MRNVKELLQDIIWLAIALYAVAASTESEVAE